MKYTADSICTDHTWQQFDSFPEYGGKIYVRQSDPDRGTSKLVVFPNTKNEKKEEDFQFLPFWKI